MVIPAPVSILAGVAVTMRSADPVAVAVEEVEVVDLDAELDELAIEVEATVDVEATVEELDVAELDCVVVELVVVVVL
jgi:hypothetical protein